VEVGKQNHFSLVGIQGADITDGQKTLTLALVWQLMRANIVATLKSLSTSGRNITDQEIVRWANQMSQKGGKSSQIRSFKDPSLATGIFLLDVLNGLKPGYVDYNLVTPGKTEEDGYLNGTLTPRIVANAFSEIGNLDCSQDWSCDFLVARRHYSSSCSTGMFL